MRAPAPGRRTRGGWRGARCALLAAPAAAVLLVGCGGARVYEPVLEPPPGWTAPEPELPADPDAAARQVAEQLDSYGFHRTFWPTDTVEIAELRSRGLVAFDGPCGPVVSAWVRSVPLEHPVIASERAVELDEGGAVVNLWPLPVNSVVGGVDRDRLLIPLRFDAGGTERVPALAVTPEGELEATTTVPELEEAEPFPCPTLAIFGDSDYLRCAIFRDRSTREPRRIAYEMPCT